MHANETHGVPHLHESLVPEALLAKIDRLTAIDRKTYAWARHRLIPKLCALRLSSNVLGEDAQACMLPTEQRGPVPLHLLLISDQGRQEETAARWQQANPGLQVTAMDMCDGAKYLSESPFWGEQYASAFRRIRYAAIKSDLLRIAYLAEHGGFYADADVCPVYNSTLSRLAASGAPLVIVASMFSGELLNAFFGAVPPRPAAPRDGTSGEERQRCIRRRAAPPRPATSGVGGAIPRRGGRARVRPARRHRRRRPAAGGTGAHTFPFGCRLPACGTVRPAA